MIVFVSRHADRMAEPDDALSAAGIDRAKLLARTLGESGVRNAWCSNTLRAQETLRPLKQLLGTALTIKVVPLGDPDGAHERHIVAAVKALPGNAVALVIGHSDTVGPIIQGLTGQTVGEVDINGFDKLFVLSLPASGAPAVTLLRYGAAA